MVKVIASDPLCSDGGRVRDPTLQAGQEIASPRLRRWLAKTIKIMLQRLFENGIISAKIWM